MSTNFTCALSGETPINDPVALPTGQICSRSLLLKKLTETSNINPFDASGKMVVDESQLIELKTINEIVPPRVVGGGGVNGTGNGGSGNSIPSILNVLSNEYDALVLELFDTRKVLEETRKELSHALYQNDAAVRVIARVVMERDMARRELANVAVVADSSNNNNSAGNKRKRMDADVVPEDEPAADASTSAAASKGIPQDIKDQFQAKWKELSSTRKAKTKASESYPTPEQISSSTAEKKSYHKTSAKGITSMAGSGSGNENGSTSMIVTSSKDKQLVHYNVDEHKIAKTTGIKTIVPSTNLMSCMGNTTALIGQDDLLRVSVSASESDQILWLDNTVEIENAVGVAVHPTGEHVIVAQADGTVHLFSIDVQNQALKADAATVWNTNGNCTCIALHPDGLLLGIGRENGSIGLWDLSTENLATTFEAKNNSPITAIDFSEKGVHIATANKEGTVTVWDLRKQKSIATLENAGDGDDDHVQVDCVSFCPIGKYLAYGTSAGDVIVTVVKDWDKKIVLKDENGSDGKLTGLVWGSGAKSLIATNDSSRVVQFWGIQG